MGKPKNKSKKGQNEDVSDDDITDPIANAEKEDEESVASHKQKAKKKGKGRKKDEDWEDDVASEIAAMSLDSKNREMNGSDENTSSSQGKNKKKKSKVSSDNEEDADEMETEPAVGKTNKMSAFQLLMENDDDNEDDRNSDEEQQSDEDTASSQPVPEAESQKQNKKKNKKKDKKKNKDEDEDIDAILADIETKSGKKSKGKKNEDKKANEEEKQSPETQEEKVQPVEGKVVSIEDFDDENDDDYKKKKKNKKEKKAKEETEDKTNEIEIEEDGEEGSTVKTAAQKRKEKREREKLKKQQEKKKKSKGAGEEESTDAAKPAEAEVESTTKNDDTKEQEQEEEDEGKGKKKKKKGEKEEKKKKPKAAVAALKAQLEKMKEEEERLRLEEEERIRKEEEAIRLKKEKERLLAEKKEREKQKKKEKIERQKKEGTYLTEKQKQERKRQLQMLEQMKAMGIQVPNKDDAPTRRPVYAKKKKPQKTDLERSESQQEEDADAEKEEEPSTQEETEVRVEETTDENVEDKVEEQEEHSEDEIAEAWDADAEVETEEDKEHTEKKEEKEKTKDTEESVEEDEDEEDDEEESEEEESDEEEDDETESSSEEESDDDSSPIEKAREKIQKRHEEAEKNRSVDNLRAPVVCVLGHVDTGKTKILDKLRRTHVQDGEAGGITQQIGATNVPETAIKEQTKMCKEFAKKELKLPGLLIIDTPGHESFGNLRSRGSSLCDIAILVVDIMHGLEPQTIESINLLKERKTPFVIALNKIDRLYQWKPMPQTDVANVIKKQSSHTKSEFDTRSREVITQIAEQGLNTALFYENKNPKEYISMVPTSAHSGDGMGNLIATICELSQSLLAKRLSYSEELQATVMEVKALHGLGTTVDVILVNGKIREGDTVIMPGTEGPIVTQVRGLLMPQPMKELRVKSQWEHHKEVKAAQGVKVIAKDLEKTLAGLPMYIAESPEEVEYYKEELSQALKEALSSIKLSERGVFVQASTLGSLEALLEFLRTSDIPYAGINIGPVHKKDIMKASIMLEHDSQYAVILAFDVKVEREAQDMADSVGVKIFTADIIYHLFDKFMAYRDELKKKKQEEFKHIAVFPCKVRILPQYIFNSRDPIVCGVQVEAGFLKKGTPLCVPSKEFLEIGRVVSIENNHNPVDIARKGTEICIKIEPLPGDTPKMIGRHFEETDQLVSKISRESIDAVKDYFREDMTKPDWQLMVELKKTFKIL